MFWRICNLMTLNIRLVFVFDGPDVPAKRERTRAGRKIDYDGRVLLKGLLKCFSIPSIEALGEAEAECCRLQRSGKVDAVWSQDSDCLLFGCTLWVRDYRVATGKMPGYNDRSKANTKKSGKLVRVVRAENLKKKCRLDSKGCVLFAVLAGGDYDTIGLRNCGAVLALQAAQSGLGISLCASQNQQDCTRWGERVLKNFFKRKSVSLVIPNQFPRFSTLQKYLKPKLHSDDCNEEILSSGQRSLRSSSRIDERSLFHMTCHRFNIWGKGYMDWIGPILLTHVLADTERAIPDEIAQDINLIEYNENQAGETSEIKISFSPLTVTSTWPVIEEVPAKWTGSLKERPNFHYRVENDIPIYLLERIRPLDAFEMQNRAKKAVTNKRKCHSDIDHSVDGFLTAKKGKSIISEERQVVPSHGLTENSCNTAQSAMLPSRSLATTDFESIQFNSSSKLEQIEELQVKEAIRMSLKSENMPIPKMDIRRTSLASGSASNSQIPRGYFGAKNCTSQFDFSATYIDLTDE